MPDQPRLRLGSWSLQGVVVVRPDGQLDLSTYAQLRDGLLKVMADEPRAVLVELSKLRVRSSALLSVFVAVWMRCSTWTNVPLVLVAIGEPLLSALRAQGVPRFVTTCQTMAEAWNTIGTTTLRRRADLGLTGAPISGRRARVFLRDTCRRWEMSTLGEDAILVGCALVDHAIEDECGPHLLRMELRPSGLAISVRSGSRSWRNPSTGPSDPDGSRSLAIVAGLSVAWGRWPARDGGEVTWAVLSLPGRHLVPAD